MPEENKVEGGRRPRRSAKEVRDAKIAAIMEKIKKYEEILEDLHDELEELKRPPQLSESEKQAMLRQKVADGALTQDEAYQLGLKL